MGMATARVAGGSRPFGRALFGEDGVVDPVMALWRMTNEARCRPGPDTVNP